MTHMSTIIVQPIGAIFTSSTLFEVKANKVIQSKICIPSVIVVSTYDEVGPNLSDAYFDIFLNPPSFNRGGLL